MITPSRAKRSGQVVQLYFAGLLLIAILLPGLISGEPLLALARLASPAPTGTPIPKEKPYAVIVGTVWGPDDHPVYGVRVKIRRAKDKKFKWETYSDHNGEFEQRFPAGECDYVITADLKGFKTSNGKPLKLVQDVTVHIYNDERADTGLHLTQ